MKTNASAGRTVVAGLAAAAAAVLAIAALAPESDAKTDPRIYSLKGGKGKIYGTRASDWTVQWWQWAYSLPTSSNPLFDESGALVELGQRGPVWFLGGIFNETGVVQRTATIPSGKALFFPILNTENNNIGVDPQKTYEQLRADAAGIIEDIVIHESMFLTVDGIAVQGLEAGRVATGPMTYALPAGNVQEFFGLQAPRGIYAPVASDGYWVMLRPLPLGQHTIHFGGTFGGSLNFTVDVTYLLTVVDSNQP